MALKAKRAGLGLEMRTFQGRKRTYIVFRLKRGAPHVFTETEAKAAARDCGSTLGKANTREHWRQLWSKD